MNHYLVWNNGLSFYGGKTESEAIKQAQGYEKMASKKVVCKVTEHRGSVAAIGENPAATLVREVVFDHKQGWELADLLPCAR